VAQHEPAVQALCDHYGERDPKALILSLCRELLAMQPTDKGPTPLAVLGSWRLIWKVHRVPLVRRSADCSGLLVQRDGRYEVTLDEEEPPGRQHRSLGHEIVHTFFREVHPGPPGLEEERLCEIGAAELTMPADRVRCFMTGRGAITFNVMNECSDEFGVTKDAAGRRLVELSDTAVCYLVATMGRTTNQERFNRGTPALRVASWAWSPSWPDRQPYRGLAFAIGSLVAQAFRSQQLRAGLARLGTNHRDGVFNIEAVGYTYPRRGKPSRQVAVLLRP
jgi:hypothetical protein